MRRGHDEARESFILTVDLATHSLSDIDTLFVDPDVRVEAALPPKILLEPFVIASRTFNP